MMNKKPKFMYRISEYGDWFAKIGRTIQAYERAGVDADGLRKSQRQVQIVQHKYKTRLRHLEWAEAYAKEYKPLYNYRLEKGDTKHEASKYAMIMAERRVASRVEKSNGEQPSERALRNAMNRLNDPDYMHDIFHKDLGSNDNDADLIAIDMEYESDAIQNEKE